MIDTPKYVFWNTHSAVGSSMYMLGHRPCLRTTILKYCNHQGPRPLELKGFNQTKPGIYVYPWSIIFAYISVVKANLTSSQLSRVKSQDKQTPIEKHRIR